MKDKKAPEQFDVTWELYKLFQTTPLKELGIPPAHTGTSYAALQRPLTPTDIDRVIASGQKRIEIAWLHPGSRELIPKWVQDEIRRLAKLNKVRVSLHGVTGIDFSSTNFQTSYKILSQQMDAAIRFVVSDEEFKKNPKKAFEEAGKALINIHLGSLYYPRTPGRGVTRGTMASKPWSPLYVIGRRDEEGKIEGLEFLSGFDNLAKVYFPEEAKKIEEEIRKDLDKYGYIRRETLEKAKKLSDLAYQYHLDQMITNLYLRIKQRLDYLTATSQRLAPLIRDLLDAVKAGDMEKVSKIKKKIMEEQMIHGLLDVNVARLLDEITVLFSYLQDIRKLGRKMGPEEFERKAEEFYKQVYRLLPPSSRDHIDERTFVESMKTIKKKMIEDLGYSVAGFQVKPITIDDFVKENSVKNISKALAMFLEKKGTIPTFVVENEPSTEMGPCPGTSIKFIGETVAKIREEFVKEAMKRRDKIMKKLEEMGFKFRDEKEFEEFLKKLAVERIGMTIDTAHAWTACFYGKPEEEIFQEIKDVIDGKIERVPDWAKKKLVKHIHAVDWSGGPEDSHLIPGQGVIDWEKFVKMIKEAQEKGEIPPDIAWIIEAPEAMTRMAGIYQPLQASPERYLVGLYWPSAVYGGGYLPAIGGVPYGGPYFSPAEAEFFGTFYGSYFEPPRRQGGAR